MQGTANIFQVKLLFITKLECQVAIFNNTDLSKSGFTIQYEVVFKIKVTYSLRGNLL